MNTDETQTVVIADANPNSDIAYDGYLPMTPGQIREFGKGFGQPNRRADGYKRIDVDPVMNRLADEVSWLQGRLRDVKAQLDAAQLGADIIEGSYRNLDEQAIQRRMDARLEADRIVEDAEKEADRIIADARLEADQIVDQAVRDAAPIDPTGEHRLPVTVETTDEIPSDDANLADHDETEGQRLQRVAAQLPDRLDDWEKGGQSIVADAQMLARAAQAALSRVASTMSSIEHALANGNVTDPPALPERT